MNDDHVALLFDDDDAARRAAELAGGEVVLLDPDYSRKTGVYGMDPHTFQHDVMPLRAAVVLPQSRIDEIRAGGDHLGALFRMSFSALEGWERHEDG